MRADQAPDLGPLDDGRRRGTFFRELWSSVGSSPDDFDDDFLPADAYAEWDVVRRTIAQTTPERVLIWTSAGSADQVFLRMAVHFLRDMQAPLWRVHVDSGDYFCSVGSAPESVLMSSLPFAAKIDAAAVRQYDTEFAAMAADPSPLRMVTPDGRFTYHDLSFFDRAIKRYCSREWRRAIHVVADTMGHADNLNPPSDLVIFSRLLHLVEAGKLELDGEFTSIHEEGFRKRLVRIAKP